MNRNLIIITALLLLSIFSCKGKDEKAKTQMIDQRVSELKTEIASKSVSTEQVSSDTIVEKQDQKLSGDSIIGVWEVSNNYYTAIYEIIKYEDEYMGKIHYYNDGKDEYENTSSKEDYFLTEVKFEDGQYTIGKMYMPDGSHYQVKFTLKGDQLTAAMTVQGEPYKEVWTRK